MFGKIGKLCVCVCSCHMCKYETFSSACGNANCVCVCERDKTIIENWKQYTQILIFIFHSGFCIYACVCVYVQWIVEVIMRSMAWNEYHHQSINRLNIAYNVKMQHDVLRAQKRKFYFVYICVYACAFVCHFLFVVC